MNRNIGTVGLSSREVAFSREKYGANVYKKKKKKTFFQQFLISLKDPIIKVLLIAMGINLLFTYKNINYYESGGILAAILLSTIVSALSEVGSEKAFEKLQKENLNRKARCIRDGRISFVPFEDVVVGDIVLLLQGEKIPADGLLTEGKISVDESSISGESKPSKKNSANKNKDALLFAGTMVLEGEGKMEVQQVGSNSLYGGIAEEIQEDQAESPLKNKLSKLAKTVSKIGYVAAILVALTYLLNVFVLDAHFVGSEILMRLKNLRFVGLSLVKAVTIAITVIVVAVPEGLPMMISVVLSSNMKKMLAGNVLVRKPVGIETAGSLNILFTDKTGTLTEGKLQCKKLIFGDCSEDTDPKNHSTIRNEQIYHSIFTNSSVEIGKNASGKNEWIGGNLTEQALCRFLMHRQSKIQSIKKAIRKIPFSSDLKYSAVLVSENQGEKVFFKGAPEKILPYCRSYLDENGQKKPFDMEKFEKIIKEYEKKSGRILAFAVGSRLSEPQHAGELSFLFIAVLADKIRKEAKNALLTLKNAGIQTVMMTGDSMDTAKAVALECGLVDMDGKTVILSGEELHKMSDREVLEVLPRLSIVSRALPKDKSRLVNLSKQKGLVVGMTGDGVNDAPALRKADVGFSMGDAAEIAKEAADIVIIDNNLASIVNAVLFGRTIFKSIRKFIVFQLTMNFCAVGVSLFGQLLTIDCPITVIQMLWVNIIMDTLGGLAFAGEYPMKMYLKEPPIKRNEKILKKQMLLQTMCMGAYGIFLSTAFLSLNRIAEFLKFDEVHERKMTAFFALFIFTGITICFTTRSERVNIFKGILKNKPFIWIMLCISLIQMIMLYYGGETFRCIGMDMRSLCTVIMFSLSVFPFDFLRRMIFKKIHFKE